MRNQTSFRPGQFGAGQAAGVAARRETAEIRAGLGDGELTLADLLGGGHRLSARASRLQVDRLLGWCPGMGAHRVTRTLGEMQLAPSTRVGDLDGAHRRALVAVANAYQPRGS